MNKNILSLTKSNYVIPQNVVANYMPQPMVSN